MPFMPFMLLMLLMVEPVGQRATRNEASGHGVFSRMQRVDEDLALDVFQSQWGWFTDAFGPAWQVVSQFMRSMWPGHDLPMQPHVMAAMVGNTEPDRDAGVRALTALISIPARPRRCHVQRSYVLRRAF